jgi:predicted nuclease of predicted toxin-antitoxin system
VRLLADECLDGRLLTGLRRAGQDVLAAREVCRGATDQVVLELARREQRVLVTEDKRVGRLILRSPVEPPGIVLVRTRGSAVAVMLRRLLAAIDREGERLHERYVVVTEQRTRVRPMQLFRGSSI